MTRCLCATSQAEQATSKTADERRCSEVKLEQSSSSSTSVTPCVPVQRQQPGHVGESRDPPSNIGTGAVDSTFLRVSSSLRSACCVSSDSTHREISEYLFTASQYTPFATLAASITCKAPVCRLSVCPSRMTSFLSFNTDKFFETALELICFPGPFHHSPHNCYRYLARSANLPEGLYILLAINVYPVNLPIALHPNPIGKN